MTEAERKIDAELRLLEIETGTSRSQLFTEWFMEAIKPKPDGVTHDGGPAWVTS